MSIKPEITSLFVGMGLGAGRPIEKKVESVEVPVVKSPLQAWEDALTLVHEIKPRERTETKEVFKADLERVRKSLARAIRKDPRTKTTLPGSNSLTLQLSGTPNNGPIYDVKATVNEKDGVSIESKLFFRTGHVNSWEIYLGGAEEGGSGYATSVSTFKKHFLSSNTYSTESKKRKDRVSYKDATRQCASVLLRAVCSR